MPLTSNYYYVIILLDYNYEGEKYANCKKSYFNRLSP